MLPHIPPDYATRAYYEPFLGAASLFLALQPPEAYLSDANPRLVECYLSLREGCTEVTRLLEILKRRDNETHYYKVRDLYNRRVNKASASQAARFIYLNRTCFNGIFRVNTSGRFNVPYGYKDRPCFPPASALAAISSALSSASIERADYHHAFAKASVGAFIYLDPPYPPLNGTSYFTHYTTERFGERDQNDLAAVVRAADSRGCLFVMTNADTPMIRQLYCGYRIERLNVTRYITCKRKKQKVSELVIRNY